MNALLKHTHIGRSKSHYAGIISNVLPEAQRSQTGVFSGYVEKENHEWFVATAYVPSRFIERIE